MSPAQLELLTREQDDIFQQNKKKQASEVKISNLSRRGGEGSELRVQNN